MKFFHDIDEPSRPFTAREHDLIGRLLKAEAAETIRKRNLDRRWRDMPEEFAGAKPPTYGEKGGANRKNSERAAATDRAILSVLAERSAIVTELAAKTGIPSKTISGAMQRIKLRGHCSTTKYRTAIRGLVHRYTITQEGRDALAGLIAAPPVGIDSMRPPCVGNPLPDLCADVRRCADEPDHLGVHVAQFPVAPLGNAKELGVFPLEVVPNETPPIGNGQDRSVTQDAVAFVASGDAAQVGHLSVNAAHLLDVGNRRDVVNGVGSNAAISAGVSDPAKRLVKPMVEGQSALTPNDSTVSLNNSHLRTSNVPAMVRAGDGSEMPPLPVNFTNNSGVHNVGASVAPNPEPLPKPRKVGITMPRAPWQQEAAE